MRPSLTYDGAVAALQEMFPSVERQVLEAVLRENGGHVENSIEQLLMSSAATQRSSSSMRVNPSISIDGEVCTTKPIDNSHPHTVLTIEQQDAILAQMLQDQLFMDELTNDVEFLRLLNSDEGSRAIISSNRASSESMRAIGSVKGTLPYSSPSSSSPSSSSPTLSKQPKAVGRGQPHPTNFDPTKRHVTSALNEPVGNNGGFLSRLSSSAKTQMMKLWQARSMDRTSPSQKNTPTQPQPPHNKKKD